MSRTERKDWKGRPIHDGEHGKRCPEPNCDYCMNGQQKRPFRRKMRHILKKVLKRGDEN